MTNILAAQSAETRAKGDTLLKQADQLLCESWNERMASRLIRERNPVNDCRHMPRPPSV